MSFIALYLVKSDKTTLPKKNMKTTIYHINTNGVVAIDQDVPQNFVPNVRGQPSGLAQEANTVTTPYYLVLPSTNIVPN